MSGELSADIVELKRDRVLATVRDRLQRGENGFAILDECRDGMIAVGKRFERGEYFLSELLLSTEIFKEAVGILEPHLGENAANRALGKVVLATMRGDIHDLGKNVLATLLRAHGLEVHDLGVNVPPEQLVDLVRELRPDFVGFSALITTAFDSMRQAAEMLVEAGLRDGLKLMVGGGVTTAAVREDIGADFQTVEAMEGVTYCLKTLGERG